MQKKLIALAVAGLVSVPAFAQSNVTIYGVVDMGYKYQGDNVIDGVKTRNAIDSGISGGSRLGFKGTEDLGNGLKAGFVLEQGINADTGTSAQGGSTFGRQSFVSLSGGFGAVALGRQSTPQHLIMAGNVDPFGLGKGTAAGLQNFYYSDARLDNLAAYVSPTWSGFNVVAGYTFNAGNTNSGNTINQNEQSPNLKNQDVRVWVISPSYKNGPIYVAANYHKLDPVLSGVESTKVWDLAGTYDFGVVKVGAIYGQRKQNDFYKMKQWALTGAVPVGAAGKVQVMYGQRKTDLEAFSNDAKVSQWGLGYEHALSKRTALYTVYAQQNQNRLQEQLAGSSLFGAGIGDASENGAVTGYQRGFNLGVRHSF